LKLPERNDGEVRYFAALLDWPADHDDLVIVESEILLQSAAQRLRIGRYITIDGSESGGFVIDTQLRIGVGLPCSDCDEAKGYRVEDGNRGKVKANDVIVGVIDLMESSDPLAAKKETNETDPHKEAYDEHAESKAREIVEPEEPHGTSLLAVRMNFDWQ